MNVIENDILQQAFVRKLQEALKLKPYELFTTFDLLISGMGMDPAALNPIDVGKTENLIASLGYERCIAVVDAGAQKILLQMWKRAGGLVIPAKPKLKLVEP